MTDRRFYEEADGDDRRVAPAAARNREPIRKVLEDWLPARGLVLEIASGSGEHALAFAASFPALDWQPSDAHPDALRSIAAWQAGGAPPNLRPPIPIDAARPPWPVPSADAIICINMVHISPWDAALGLIAGSAALLPAGAPLILYGPWLEEGVEPAPGNLAFDRDLQARDPRWGLRKVEDFEAAAAPMFRLESRRAMPANNLMLRFLRNG